MSKLHLQHTQLIRRLLKVLSLFWSCVGGDNSVLWGHLEEIRVQSDTATQLKHNSGMNGGLLDQCLSSHTLFCYSLFICHPIKHSALSDTHRLSEKTRFCQSYCLPAFRRAFVDALDTCCLFFILHEKKNKKKYHCLRIKQDVTGEVENLKSAVCTDYSLIVREFVSSANVCFFYLMEGIRAEEDGERSRGP